MFASSFASDRRRRLPPSHPLNRPRAGEAARLWGQCVPVTADTEVVGWLRESDIDAQVTAALDLARALPRDIATPPWARYGTSPWNVDGYRLLLPMYSASGEMDALYARALRPLGESTVTKKSCPVVTSLTGLILANEVGRHLLRTGDWPDNSSWRTVIIAGGAIDFLEWSAAVQIQAAAVLGIVPGSWTDELAARIPDGCRVMVRAHSNPITGRYAHRVQAALHRRCEVIIRTAS